MIEMNTNLDNRQTAPAAIVGRYLSMVGLTFLIIATGCAARREALTANAALASATQTASQATKDLAKATDAEVKELKEVRDDYRKLVATYANARAQEAREKMEGLAQATLTDIARQYGKALVDLQTTRASVNGKLDKELKLALQPIVDKVTGLKALAETAADKSKAFPNDADRARDAKSADAAYLAAEARKIEIERDAIKTATISMDQAQTEFLTRLATALGEHEKKAAAVLKNATDALGKGKDIPKIDFGSDPPSNAESFAGLVKYTDAVSKISDAYEDYIKSNSLGQGSFFRDFIKSAAKGLAGGVVQPSSVKALSPESIKASLTDLISALDPGLAESLEAVKASFKTASSAISGDAASGLVAKASEAIQKAATNSSPK